MIPRDIVSSEPRHWMEFVQFAWLCSAVLRHGGGGGGSALLRHARSCWRAMRSKQKSRRALAKSTSQTFARKNDEDEDEESEEDDENDGEDEDG